MGEMISFAKSMIDEHGEFLPFGGYVDSHGDITHVSVDMDGDDHPRAEEMIHELKLSLKTLADNKMCRCTAIVFDVRITLPGTNNQCDAIQVNVDHQEGLLSAEVFHPYVISEDSSVTYLDAFAQEGLHEVFGS
jgi:hypothetical protein